MKYFSSLFLVLIILSGFSCSNKGSRKNPGTSNVSAVKDYNNLIPVATDIVSEIIVKPASADDPWELEKVKGFNGDAMFLSLLGKIKEGKIRVYDCISGKEFSEEEAKKIIEETGSDVSRIAKLQFTEDWYFDTENNEIIKKVKSVSLGYESPRADGLPPAYLPYFRIKTE